MMGSKAARYQENLICNKVVKCCDISDINLGSVETGYSLKATVTKLQYPPSLYNDTINTNSRV